MGRVTFVRRGDFTIAFYNKLCIKLIKNPKLDKKTRPHLFSVYQKKNQHNNFQGVQSNSKLHMENGPILNTKKYKCEALKIYIILYAYF